MFKTVIPNYPRTSIKFNSHSLLIIINLLLLQLTVNICDGIYLTQSGNATGSLSNLKRNNPAFWTEEEGIWGPTLEEWIIGKENLRKGRVMQIPISNVYIAEEKIEQQLSALMKNDNEKESKINNGKIVVNNNKLPQKQPQLQNINKVPNQRPVISENDLYLLNAIEKLVYRMDFMEKRLRRVEEMLYYTMAGNRVDQEPCKENFTRIGSKCYSFSSAAGREYDWKVASKQCKKIGGYLAEMDTIQENQDVIAYIQSNQQLRGKDFWTGGLNPGLLWIWSNSARPVTAPGSEDNKKNPSAAIQGEGRCLKLAYNPALRSYTYRGHDCSIRYSYICELPETTSSNELTQLGKHRRIID